jgi:periplasmic copper chaperone A
MRLLKEITFATALTVSSLFTMEPVEAHQITIGNLVIDDPWSRETTGNAEVAAGFMNIVNNGTEADTLISVTATISDKMNSP